MHLESELESESESEYNSSLYQSESTSESPFKEVINLFFLLSFEQGLSVSKYWVGYNLFLFFSEQATAFESKPAGFEADANNALAAGRFRFHSNTSVCCKGDRSASGDYGPQRKIDLSSRLRFRIPEEI
ncbi:hypothetical protein SDJN03_15859, partial [Cucurbita argyrosperma subsp. sororia]